MGNPGPRFVGTRHNLGFDVVDALSESEGLPLRKPFLHSFEWSGRSESLILAKPLTFMNRSGTVLPALLRRTRSGPDDLVVICDNLDLPVGLVRLKRSGSSRSHNGIASVMDAVGSGEFTRIYIGIGRPNPGESVVDHVLGTPPASELATYQQAVSRAATAIRELVDTSPEAVMNSLNRKAGANGTP